MERKRFLRGVAVVVVGVVISAAAGSARAQVAGTATIGVSTEEMKLVALGWSARNKIVLPGATKEALKAMPKFEYVN